MVRNIQFHKNPYIIALVSLLVVFIFKPQVFSLLNIFSLGENSASRTLTALESSPLPGVSSSGCDVLLNNVSSNTDQINSVYKKIPLVFESNQGQAEPNIKYVAKSNCYTVFLAQDGMKIALTQPTVSSSDSPVFMNFVDSNPGAKIAGEELLDAKVNYFIGKDSQKWQMGVPLYQKVRYASLYPSIDVVYYGNYQQAEYDFIVSPKGDPLKIVWAFKGVNNLAIDYSSGNLIIDTSNGQFKLKKPYAYQDINGTKKEINIDYVLKDNFQVGLKIGKYDISKPLIIDPALVYSGYLPGFTGGRVNSMAVDSLGNVYIVGLGGDVSVLKISSGGKIVYSAIVGGSGDDRGFAIAVDSSGNSYVTGTTNSSDFPTVKPFQSTFGGAEDAFLFKLDSSGSSLVYSTYIGGSNGDAALSLKVDATGNAYITGATVSNDFPVAKSYQSSLKGSEDAFVTKVDPTGSSLVYSTYLGGSGVDDGLSIDVDLTGNAYLTGTTDSTNFPTANAYQSSLSGSQDVFVAKLNSTGSALTYSTYLGGNGKDIGKSITADTAGNAYITGLTESSNFPTSNALQATFGGVVDAFVTKLGPTGSTLVYSTYLGGDRSESGNSIATDLSGNTYVAGATNSTNFTVSGPLQTSLASDFLDAFIAKINATGSAFFYSTYLGGSGNDVAMAVSTNTGGDLTVVGTTDSSDFPLVQPIVTSGAFFIAKLDPATIAMADAATVAIGATATVSVPALIAGNAGVIATFTNNPILGGIWSKGGTADNIAGYNIIASSSWLAAVSDGKTRKTVSFGPVIPDQWSHLVTVFDKNKLLSYKDGVLQNSTDVSSFGSISNGLGAAIGKSNSDFYNGDIDEVRVYSGALSSDWIKTEYNNQSSPSTFFTFGAQEAVEKIPSSSWWDPNWLYRKPITINKSKLSGSSDLNNFPVLVELASSNFDFSKARANGSDLRFIDHSTSPATYLAYEIEEVSYPNKAKIWVKIPTVSVSKDTTFYVYYFNDSSEPDGQSPANLWADGYKGVWHLSESPSGNLAQIKDSTSNSNHGAVNGSMASSNQIPGQIDGSLRFDGKDDSIDIGDPTNGSLDFETNPFSISMWARVPSSKGTATIRVARFSTNPGTQNIIDTGGGYLDLKIGNADLGDNSNVNLYYPSTIKNSTENLLQLLYFDGLTWNKVKSQNGVDPILNKINNLDGSLSGGKFTVIVDKSSTPKVNEFTGTTMTIAGGGAEQPITIEALIEQVQALGIKKTDELLKKLEEVQKFISKDEKDKKDKSKQARKHLEQFIDKVQKLEKKGELTSETAESLINYAIKLMQII